SFCVATGRILVVANSRAASRISCCSSVSEKSIMAPILCDRRSGGRVLDQHRETLANADAERRHAAPCAAPTHFERQRSDDARAGTAERVTERDPAAVDVEDRMVDP